MNTCEFNHFIKIKGNHYTSKWCSKIKLLNVTHVNRLREEPIDNFKYRRLIRQVLKPYFSFTQVSWLYFLLSKLLEFIISIEQIFYHYSFIQWSWVSYVVSYTNPLYKLYWWLLNCYVLKFLTITNCFQVCFSGLLFRLDIIDA